VDFREQPSPSSPSSFDGLGLSGDALASVREAGYDVPTPVQVRAIPPALAGRDVIATAATGTGKTAAYVLPIVERLAGRRGTRALVLAPTRELVQQIAGEIRRFGGRRGVRCVEIVGGLGMGPQELGLREGREVIVATPGRLIDHLERGTARLGAVEVLVLDEADRMLDMGFAPQMESILTQVPKRRQTLLLSATMGREVADFARDCLVDPVRVEVARSGTVAARAEQRVFHVPQHAKTALLEALLAGDERSTLVFTRTKSRAERLAKHLHRAGLAVARIHGDRSQAQRTQALDGFRSGRVRVLVATDVAARGLDVEDVGHVVNFDLSLVADDHVHRVGRTARAAASGLATSFCAPEERHLLHAIERFTRIEIAHADPPAGFEAPPAPAPKPGAHGARAPRGGRHEDGRAPHAPPHAPRRAPRHPPRDDRRPARHPEAPHRDESRRDEPRHEAPRGPHSRRGGRPTGGSWTPNPSWNPDRPRQGPRPGPRPGSRPGSPPWGGGGFPRRGPSRFPRGPRRPR
jgi:ATP-dependent RNA helicase RhlE